MNTQEEARELMAQQHQHEQQRANSMSTRSLAEIDIHTTGETNIQEEVRDLMVEHRQQEKHVQQTMLNRSTAEVGVPVDSVNTLPE